MTFPSKRCFKCGRVQPVTEFYVHRRMGDGRLGKCKECARRDVRENRAQKRDFYNAMDRSRKRADLEQRRARTMAWIARNPLAPRAHSAVKEAKRRGSLVVQPCSTCGSATGVQAHHPDYTRPLDVEWLCKSCHRRLHAGTL